MVTSRRQIVRDEDRYGGFAETEIYDKTEIDEREISDDILKMRSFVAEPVKEEPVKVQPSAPAPAKKPTPERVDRTAPPARDYEKKAAPAPARKNIRDVMPEIVRPKREVREASVEPTPVIREKKLTATTKRALVIYMTIVLAIVAGIIATGVAVSGVSADILSYETSIAQQEETIISQREALAAIEASVKEEAEKMGMVEIADGEIKGYDKLEIGGNTEDASGIFDNIRDWFNSVFGG